jgi:2-polyprenyl-3-methyl-5-hydroxy-6-metoxy-1,4-benzoquinol methylase
MKASARFAETLRSLFSRRPFTFGENWEAFAAGLSEDAVRRAEESLVALLGRDAISGRDVLDVGCGSGLFAASAARLGGRRVVALDIDPKCVLTSRAVAEKLGVSGKVTVAQASALEGEALHRLGEFDLVYAWGSLHHTGAMWQAIGNVLETVAPRGTLALAIYNKSITSRAWRGVKRAYNASPRLLRYPMLAGYLAVKAPYCLLRGWKLWDRERGMNILVDAVDWLGGYPYEYATPREVVEFVEKAGFSTLRVIPTRGLSGCNEFVFVRKASA